MKNDRPRAVGLSDLGGLTLRANVAFAVRCAQRLRPCFKLAADAPGRREKLAAVDGAIRVASAFCQGFPGEAGRAAAAAQRARLVAEETGPDTRFAAFAAVRAAEAVAQAEEFIRTQADFNATEVVAAAFGASRVLSANADADTLDLVMAALVADATSLRSRAHGSCLQLGPSVDPSDRGPLGPLWPNGTPSWLAVD